ncbi:MAG: outer membrane lipoprotein chaperone LolA [Gammaproteobacteria bacterium]|nr:outer membrane lipoprotein chaperone LolA [Gammaproteobacteria bacterium]
MNIKIWAVVLALFALGSVAAPAWAGVGQVRLQAFFQGLHGLRADFVQTLRDGKLNEVQRSSGTLALQRPGKFRWDYRKPYHQLIVADGHTLWIYDHGLEQVTERPLGKALGNTPAMLLSSTEPLQKNFTVTDLGERNGLAWVELQPKAKDTGFTLIRLGFSTRTLKVMDLVDSFGQVTHLSFSNVRRNPALSPSLFEFTPPKGADVIKARG